MNLHKKQQDAPSWAASLSIIGYVANQGRGPAAVNPAWMRLAQLVIVVHAAGPCPLKLSAGAAVRGQSAPARADKINQNRTIASGAQACPPLQERCPNRFAERGKNLASAYIKS